MKHKDPRIEALFQHIRAVVDLLEDIATKPHRPEPPQPPVIAKSLAPPAERPISISVKQASKLTGLASATIYRRIEDGTLRSVVVGSRRLVLYESIEAMVARTQ